MAGRLTIGARRPVVPPVDGVPLPSVRAALKAAADDATRTSFEAAPQWEPAAHPTQTPTTGDLLDTLTYPSSGTTTTVVICAECGGVGGSHALACSHALIAGNAAAGLRSALTLARDALRHAEQTCRYHGADFDRLGRESDGAPRCDSCKQPWRVTTTLAAIGGAL